MENNKVRFAVHIHSQLIISIPYELSHDKDYVKKQARELLKDPEVITKLQHSIERIIKIL